MNKDSIIDYLAFILFKLVAFVVRKLPVSFSLFLGRRLGDMLFALDRRHRAIAHVNIKRALGDKLSLAQINNTTREFYRSYGQNLMEVFLIPLIDRNYIDKYITIEGRENVDNALKQGKGIIFLAVHEGSWELSGVIASTLGVNFNFLFREQEKFKRLAALLNSYRTNKGCKIIQRQQQTRRLIEVVKNHEVIGMTIDQGGKAGVPVEFFGKSASMATGAVRIALKYQTVILPVFLQRLSGPHIKLFIEKPFEVKASQDIQSNIEKNLQELIRIFEKYITMYPNEYLWSYKIWKHGLDKNILILSDGKVGHLRQSQAVANIISNHFKINSFNVKVETAEVKFNSGISRTLLGLCSCLSGRYSCQGCLACLKKFLDKKSYDSLIAKNPDVIISCGSSLAALNLLLSRENLAKSFVLMQPSIFCAGKFDLVIAPRHDNPVKRKNTIMTEGALNLISTEYLKEQTDKLVASQNSNLKTQGFYIGLLIGGDSKGYRLERNTILEVTNQIKSACENLNADVLVTTSRRTSKEIEDVVKNELAGYKRCKLLVIANEKNLPETVGGILGLSSIVITTPESISMISEAVSSKKYVLVFKSGRLSKKHERFLNTFSKNGHLRLIKDIKELSEDIKSTWINKPVINTLSDNKLVIEAVRKIL